MQIDIIEDWPDIRRVFNSAFSSSLHFAIASSDALGTPHVSPIGSVMLTSPGRGIFLQLYTTGLPRRLAERQELAILAVNSGKAFWFRSLFVGRFIAPPGLRLHARVSGPPRPPTEQEIARFRRRVRVFKRFRGYDLLWKDTGMARDFEVLSAEPIRLGRMTHGHGSVESGRKEPPRRAGVRDASGARVS